MNKKPFIYIASLKRTGSTVLSEALTSLPASFIFIEPKFTIGRFAFKRSAIETFRKYGIDLGGYKDIDRTVGPKKLWLARRGLGGLIGANKSLKTFRYDIFPLIEEVVTQVGVKEIWHVGWHRYLDYFDDVRIILTARDPRDLFISTYNRVQSGKETYRNGFSGRELARQLNRAFRSQKEMHERAQCIQVRYEDLCHDKGIIVAVKEFVGCSEGVPGEIGGYLKSNEARHSEFELHGEQITSKRVGRWELIEDPEIAREANKFFDLMAEYAEFWGYVKN